MEKVVMAKRKRVSDLYGRRFRIAMVSASWQMVLFSRSDIDHSTISIVAKPKEIRARMVYFPFYIRKMRLFQLGC